MPTVYPDGGSGGPAQLFHQSAEVYSLLSWSRDDRVRDQGRVSPFLRSYLERGDLAATDEFLSEDFVNREVEGTQYPHRELYKEGVVETRTAYPDWTLVIEDLVAAGDRVTARWRAWGTHTGEARGVASSGKREAFSKPRRLGSPKSSGMIQ
jgi:predicted ester cyclase